VIESLTLGLVGHCCRQEWLTPHVADTQTRMTAEFEMGSIHRAIGQLTNAARKMQRIDTSGSIEAKVMEVQQNFATTRSFDLDIRPLEAIQYVI